MNNNFKHCHTLHDFLSVVNLGLFLRALLQDRILALKNTRTARRDLVIINVKCITLYVYNMLTIYKLFTMLFLGVDLQYQHTLLFCMAPCLLPIWFLVVFSFFEKLPIVVVRDVCPSVRPSVCPSVRPSVRLSVCGNNFFSR